MSSWGDTDTLADAPKWITNEKIFDGSDVAVVDLTLNQLVIPSHGLITGDPITYITTGAITPLVDDTIYYVIRVDSDIIALATTSGNADIGTRIVLTVVGSGTTDTILKTPSNLYFIDIEESQVPANRAKGLKSPGWWFYHTYVAGDGGTHHHAEQIVALPRTAAQAGDVGVDGSDDAVVADS